jgi:hypothetical protein
MSETCKARAAFDYVVSKVPPKSPPTVVAMVFIVEEGKVKKHFANSTQVIEGQDLEASIALLGRGITNSAGGEARYGD